MGVGSKTGEGRTGGGAGTETVCPAHNSIGVVYRREKNENRKEKKKEIRQHRNK